MCSFEKNWLFFEHEGVLHVVYSLSPFCVYKIIDARQDSAEKVLCVAWRFYQEDLSTAELRGSTPPVRIGQTYYLFAHSRAYDVHVLAFSASTLIIESASYQPALQLQHHQPFVCGAIHVESEGTWFLSMGIDDVSIAVYSMSHSHLLQLLQPVKFVHT